MKEYSLLVNDNLIATGKSKTDVRHGALDLHPNRGRFIFSLFPREGYSFQKTGTVPATKLNSPWTAIATSGSRVHQSEGRRRLESLGAARCAIFTALRGAATPPTEKSALEKLDELMNSTLKKSSNPMKTKPSAFRVGPDPTKVEKKPLSQVRW
jgi:hypothetical protein